MTKANVTEVNDPIVMTQLIDNPTEEYDKLTKCPETTLIIYQNETTHLKPHKNILCQ